ncbi:TolC family protein [Desulfoscipio geothermicus]|uniref:Outer membrane efflux protein n=1 Tax=Desulfoscipio geothermicus DSM 3669 TaxID=1121426 RepID=A0A1I6EME4_9FIRM|nr:TolC family protein [Desulfoscipio geothermicus]SFR18678.1 Outer membrane efflux protein [Desulfoscipio geothermicus DSM 3669]
MRKIGLLLLFLVILLGFATSNALASELPDGLQQLTLVEAVDMAIKNSDEIKIQEEVADKAWDQRERAVDNITFIPAGVRGGGYVPQAEAAYSGLLQADLNYQIQRKEIQNKIDKITLGVYEQYCKIRNLEKKAISLQKALEEAEWNKKIARAQLSVGVMAPPAMVGVDALLQGAQSEFKAVEEELNKAHVELNKFLGIKANERVRLIDSIPYETLVVDDLDHDVDKAVKSNIDIWKALQKVTIERKDLSFLSKPYDVEEHDIDIAEMSVSEAKKELQKQVRLLYYDIKSLEEAMKAAEQGVLSAQEALRVEKLKYEVGIASKGDVLAAEKNLEKAEYGLTDLKFKHSVAAANYLNLVGKNILPMSKDA